MPTRTEPRPDSAQERRLDLARRRFARRQWARRWLAWRVVLSVVLVVTLVGGGVWLIFFSAALAVTGAQVEGTAVLSQSEVRSRAAVPIGSPLATLDLDAIAARVERLVPVKDVDVTRAWPDRVRIDVTERVPVAVVEQDGSVQGVDEDGVVFRDYPGRPGDLPLLRVEESTSAAALAEAAQVVEVLPAALAPKVDYVEVRTVDEITLRLRDGRTVLWGSADQSADKAAVLEVLLAQKGSTYDVSVPGRPVLRP